MDTQQETPTVPYISVVIPAYNEEKYLPARLRAVGQQEDAPPYEVIVVDNASTDGTVRIAHQCGARLVTDIASNGGLAMRPITIMTLPSRLKATVALMRFREIVLFVLVTTLLGANVGGARPGPRLLVVLLGNLLVVAFAFMINDVEDAPDDALTPAKAARNPISAGHLSPRTGYGASLAVAIGGLTLYAALGMWPLALGGLCLALGLLYSWRQVRLKAIPVADLISHVLMLAALQFLCAYTAFQPGGRPWLTSCLFVVAISMYGQLLNQLRDLDGDRRAGINHTVARTGHRAAHVLMVALLAGAAALLALSVWQGSIPLWTIGLGAGLIPIMLVIPARRARLSDPVLDTHELLHGPILSWAVIVLLAWLAVSTLMH